MRQLKHDLIDTPTWITLAYSSVKFRKSTSAQKSVDGNGRVPSAANRLRDRDLGNLDVAVLLDELRRSGTMGINLLTQFLLEHWLVSLLRVVLDLFAKTMDNYGNL